MFKKQDMIEDPCTDEAGQLTIINGYGQDSAMTWKREDSFVVFGLGLEVAKELGINYQQNAIVWSGADAIPQLILLKQKAMSI